MAMTTTSKPIFTACSLAIDPLADTYYIFLRGLPASGILYLPK